LISFHLFPDIENNTVHSISIRFRYPQRETPLIHTPSAERSKVTNVVKQKRGRLTAVNLVCRQPSILFFCHYLSHRSFNHARSIFSRRSRTRSPVALLFGLSLRQRSRTIIHAHTRNPFSLRLFLLSTILFRSSPLPLISDWTRGIK